MQLNKRTACPYPFFFISKFSPFFFFLITYPPPLSVQPKPFLPRRSPFPSRPVARHHAAQQLLYSALAAASPLNSSNSQLQFFDFRYGTFFSPLSSLILAVAIAILFVAGFTRVFAGICRSSHMIDSGGSLDWMTILYVS